MHCRVRRQQVVSSGFTSLPSVSSATAASAVISSASSAAATLRPAAAPAVSVTILSAAVPVASGSASAPTSHRPVGPVKTEKPTSKSTTTSTSLTGDPEIDALIGQLLQNPAMQEIMQDVFVELLGGLDASAPATGNKGGFDRRQSTSTSITGDSELDDLIGQLLSNPDVLQFIEGLLSGSLGGDGSAAAVSSFDRRSKHRTSPSKHTTAKHNASPSKSSTSTSITGDPELDDLIEQLLSNPDVLEFIQGLLSGSLGGDGSPAAAAPPLDNPIGGEASSAASFSATAVASSATASDAVEPSATAISAAASSAVASGAVASSAVASDALESSAAAPEPTSDALIAGRGIRKSFARRRLALEELD
jgi:hypothetical protein